MERPLYRIRKPQEEHTHIMKSTTALRRLAGTLPLLALLACGGDSSGPGGGGGGGGGFSLSLDVQPILSSNCALSGCHATVGAQLGLDLSSGRTFASTVGIPAVELSTMNLVTPSNTAQSYLVHKIEGTQASVGGIGGRMPLGGSALSATQIATIKGWIDAGAPDN